jgi:membrane dipeptidase
MFTVTQEALALHRSSVVIDWHCDSLLEKRIFGYDFLKRHEPIRWLRSPITRHADLPRSLGNVTCFGMGIVPNPLARDPWEGLMIQVREFERCKAADDRLVFADTTAQIRAAHQDGKLSAFLGIEGAHGLGGRLDRVAEFEELGIRYMTLAHFNSNEFTPAAQGWKADNEAPLPPIGYELLEAMAAHRIIIDLAHVGRRAFLDAAAWCKDKGVPAIVSHTACCAVCPSNRAVTDEQIKAVADTGGVIGIIFTPGFLSQKLIDDIYCLLPHMQHVRNTVGIDALALGSDFDGWIATLPKHLQDVTDMPAVTQLMLEDGWSETDIKKCLGDNSLRVIAHVRA